MEIVQDSTIDDIIKAGIPVKKIPKQSILNRLFDREVGNYKPGSLLCQTRRFHTCIFPSFTIYNIEKPNCFLRKFTTCGRFFIAFSSDQTSIEMYEFRGSASAEHHLKQLNIKTHVVSDSESRNVFKLRSDVFKLFFKHCRTISVAANGEHLNRECSLFTDDGKFVIVGSAVFISEVPSPEFFDLYSNNESISQNRSFPLENVTIHLVELSTGFRTDFRHFRCDKIALSHNQGLSLHGSTLAVLSLQQQTIHLFEIGSDGKLIDVRSVGRFCYDDDSLFITSSSGCPILPGQQEKVFTGLKQRFLAHMFNEATIEKESGNQIPLLQFYHNFAEFENLRLWKMQLLDNDHLLLKFTSFDIVTAQSTDPNSHPAFFVIYDITNCSILQIFRNTSEKFLTLFENECDTFRNAALSCESRFLCSPGSSTYARQLHNRFKQTMINARYGGQMEAIRRLLTHVPISAQSFSSSPYLDLEFFSYDDKWVSVLERPKNCGDYPIRFYARDSGILRYRLHLGPSAGSSSTSGRRLVAFTFHPFEPFAISVQRTNAEYVICFHFRHNDQIHD